MNTPYITAGKACEILRISKRTLFRWEEEGKIYSQREGVLKVRLYNMNHIKQTAEILELNRLEEEHCAKLPAIRAKVKKYLLAHEVQPGDSVKIMDIDKANEAFNEEEAWTKEHN